MLTLLNALFNICLCLFVPGQSFDYNFLVLVLVLPIMFAALYKAPQKPLLLRLGSILSLVCFGLAFGSNEV